MALFLIKALGNTEMGQPGTPCSQNPSPLFKQGRSLWLHGDGSTISCSEVTRLLSSALFALPCHRLMSDSPVWLSLNSLLLKARTRFVYPQQTDRDPQKRDRGWDTLEGKMTKM